jgi:hypothetical protein
MRSPKQLRAEVHRLHLTLLNTVDAAQRRQMAGRALELAQRAEIIESLPDDVEGLCVRIAHYDKMLAVAGNQHTQRAIAEVLRSAEYKLEQISTQQRSATPNRVAAA